MEDKKYDKLGEIKSKFPIFAEYRAEFGQNLTYLDTAATSQKPVQMIETLDKYYKNKNSNIHRGVYRLASNATLEFESIREKTSKFINAKHSEEIIFTKGTTESLNLLALSLTDSFLQEGDEIILTQMEHHANIVPWQIACARKSVKIKVLPVIDNGALDLALLPSLITPRTKLISVSHVSNVLGTINPVAEITRIAHKNNMMIVVDGAQAVGHLPIDVTDINCDFYVFSAHKTYGPMGVGILYGRRELLDKMQPYQGGGEMIRKVSFEKTTYNDLPFKFEAGTPNVAGVLAFGSTLDFLQNIDINWIVNHEKSLINPIIELLKRFGARVLGHGDNVDTLGIISFSLPDIHSHDFATILDSFSVAVRAGHHCAMPLMDRFCEQAVSRVSIGIYNDEKDIEQFGNAMESTIKFFK